MSRQDLRGLGVAPVLLVARQEDRWVGGEQARQSFLEVHEGGK
jgi:hypothetical protein